MFRRKQKTKKKKKKQRPGYAQNSLYIHTSIHPSICPSISLALRYRLLRLSLVLSLLLLLLPFFSTKVQGGEHTTIKSNKRPFPFLSFLSFVGTSLSLLREERGAIVHSMPLPSSATLGLVQSSYIALSTAGKGFVETRAKSQLGARAGYPALPGAFRKELNSHSEW